MNNIGWDQRCANAIDLMIDYVQPYVTPLSEVVDKDCGRHWGSGSYFRYDGKVFLITNEHVAAKLVDTSITHQFMGADHVFRFATPFVACDYPFDLAISRIATDVWSYCSHCAVPIEFSRFSQFHEPVPGECFFTLGYSNERSGFHFGTFVANGIPYLTQEAPIPDSLADPSYHFLLHYLPELATPTVANSPGLPAPDGLSGSLVWNTRLVERMLAGEEWTPNDAVVTGIVCRWLPQFGALRVLRAEHLHSQVVALCAEHGMMDNPHPDPHG